MNNEEFKFELKISIDWRCNAYALLIEHDNRNYITFYDTLTEVKNALSTILLELNI